MLQTFDDWPEKMCPMFKRYQNNCIKKFFTIEVALEIPFCLFNIYLIVLVRQNYINLRDGAGEVYKR